MSANLTNNFPHRTLFPRRGVCGRYARRPVTRCARAAAAHVGLLLFTVFFCCVAPARAQFAIPVRIGADVVNPGGNVARALITGNSWEFDVAILANGQVSNIWPYTSTITLSICTGQNATATPLLSATLTNGNPLCTNFADATVSSINTNLSQSAWSNNGGIGPLGYPTNLHARFVFPSAQTAISLSGGISRQCVLFITLTSTNATAPQILTAFIGTVSLSAGSTLGGASVPIPYAVIVNGAGTLQSPANFFTASLPWYPSTIFISTAGSDTNAGTNLLSPFLTLTNALTTASNLGGNVTIQLGAGSFPVPPNAAYINTNIALIGEGAGATFIVTPTTANGAGLVVAGDNVYLRGFSFGTNTHSGTAYFPLVPLRGTNFYAQDLIGSGDSDVVYVTGSFNWTSAFTGSFVNCVFYSGYDCVNCEAGYETSSGASTNSILSFAGCSFNVVADPGFGARMSRGIYHTTGNLFVADCSFNITNNANVYTTGIEASTDNSSVANIATATVRNCAFNVTNTAHPAEVSGIVLNSAAGAPAVLNVIGPINPGSINNSTGTVNYDSAQFASLAFVGAGVTAPVAIAGVGQLWVSNNCLMYVTTAHTNLITLP